MFSALIALSLHCMLLIVLSTKITFLSKVFFSLAFCTCLPYLYLSLRHLASILNGGVEEHLVNIMNNFPLDSS